MGVKYLLVAVFLCCSPAKGTYVDDVFRGGKKQLKDNTCGISSVIFVLGKYYNKDISELELIKVLGIKPEYSFLDLVNISRSLGIDVYGVKVSINNISNIHSPTILYIKRLGKDHFVVFLGINNKLVQLYDPAWGYINYTHEQFAKYWLNGKGTGRALIFLKHENILVDERMVYQKNIYID